jgi:hypothetical protein
LDAAPFSTREIIGNLANPVRLDVERIEIVHYYVSRCAYAQYAAVAEAGSLGRQGG